MNRATKAVLGAAAAVALTAVQVTPATASDKYPTKDGWQYENVGVDVPAGFACDGDVRFRFKGHYRIIEKSATRTIIQSGADYRMRLRNSETGKSIIRDISGDFDDRLINGGKDLKTYATGKNVYFAAGITGIVWADKRQTVYIYGVDDPAQSTTVIDTTTGRTEELCRRVGLRAVPGKNLPEGVTSMAATGLRRG